jgi:type II secretory pathway pseudopilin PulG
MIEVLVVITIFGILLSLGVASYRGWKMRHDMELQMRRTYSDLMDLRVMAKTKGIRHFMTFAATQVTANEDTDSSGTLNGGDAVLCLWNRKTGQAADGLCANAGSVSAASLTYPVKWGTNATLGFDPRGLADADGTVCIDFAANEATNTSYDCVGVTGGMVSMGKLVNPGGACNNVNCAAKK